jgi:hypothetical protein
MKSRKRKRNDQEEQKDQEKQERQKKKQKKEKECKIKCFGASLEYSKEDLKNGIAILDVALDSNPKLTSYKDAVFTSTSSKNYTFELVALKEFYQDGSEVKQKKNSNHKLDLISNTTNDKVTKLSFRVTFDLWKKDLQKGMIPPFFLHILDQNKKVEIEIRVRFQTYNHYSIYYASFNDACPNPNTFRSYINGIPLSNTLLNKIKNKNGEFKLPNCLGQIRGIVTDNDNHTVTRKLKESKSSEVFTYTCFDDEQVKYVESNNEKAIFQDILSSWSSFVDVEKLKRYLIWNPKTRNISFSNKKLNMADCSPRQKIKVNYDSYYRTAFEIEPQLFCNYQYEQKLLFDWIPILDLSTIVFDYWNPPLKIRGFNIDNLVVSDLEKENDKPKKPSIENFIFAKFYKFETNELTLMIDFSKLYLKKITNVTIDASPQDTIETIKQKIKNKTSLSMDDKTLMFGRKFLDDEQKTVQNYKLKYNSLLHIVLQQQRR